MFYNKKKMKIYLLNHLFIINVQKIDYKQNANICKNF